VAALLDAGASGILDLTEDGEFLRGRRVLPYTPILDAQAAARGADVERRREPIEDLGSSAEATTRALRDIDEMLGAGRTVYVHCLGGIGRTGTVVGAWLADRGLAPGAEAVGLIRDLRKASGAPPVRSPETDEQRRLVASWRPGPRALIL
jgi:protein-tyrosine phosphatase